MQEHIKISLVIPTRERAETLKYTIQTALNQKLEAYEVIVSDNFSQDNTKEVVDSFDDSRLKYVNTMQRLTMTENFSFGVSQAKGEYIITIGDDDGIMPNAIDELAELIDIYPSMLYFWPRHGYIWPSATGPSRLERIIIEKGSLFKVNLKDRLRSMLQKGICFSSGMPTTYHSATHRSIFDKIKTSTGTYYQTPNPDAFMLLTLPVFSEFATNVGYPLSVNGHSPKSNSGRQLNIDEDTAKKKSGEVEKFIQEFDSYKLHQSIPKGFPKTVSFVLDTFLYTRDLHAAYYLKLKTNYSAMWAYAWQIFFLNDIFEPVKRRKEIQQNESFSAATYLLYSLLFFTFLNLIKKLSIKSRQEKNFQALFDQNPPKNVNEFVTFVYQHQSLIKKH